MYNEIDIITVQVLNNNRNRFFTHFGELCLTVIPDMGNMRCECFAELFNTKLILDFCELIKDQTVEVTVRPHSVTQ